MAHVQFTDVQDRPTEFLDLTSLTLDEFHQLVPPFEAAFQAHMAAWRLDGTPRTARQLSVYKNCPLPTPEDRLFFLLTYLKTYSLQVVQGRLFGMGQSKANQWLHVLLPALLAALRTLGDAPTRSLAALAQRLGVSETDAATVVAPLEEVPVPLSAGEHGDAGGYAATGISSISRSMSGYQRLKMALSSPFSVRTRVCNNKCAPSLDHCICCFLQKRLLTTSFTVDSTNPVAIGSPLRYRSP